MSLLTTSTFAARRLRAVSCAFVVFVVGAVLSSAAARSDDLASGGAACDGSLDAADLVPLIAALFNDAVCSEEGLNGDGSLTAADLIALVRNVAGPTPTPTITAPPCGLTDEATPIPSSPCSVAEGAFFDCFATSGLDAGSFANGMNGAAVADVDSDGYPDVFFFNTANVARLFRNLGHDMQFENITEAPLVWPDQVVPVAAAFGDLDNDGRSDLVVVVDNTSTSFFCPDRRPLLNTLHVYRNIGDGKFDEVGDEWGFGPVPRIPNTDKPAQAGISLVDLNFDRRLDVIEYYLDVNTHPVTFLSQPDGVTWEEAGRDIFGDARGLTFTIFFTDANRDQLLDAFVINDNHPFRPAKYFRRIDRSLAFEQAELLPTFGTQPFGSPMGAATADLDGDGELEMVVSDTGDQRLFSSGMNVAEAWGVAQNPSRYGMPQNCWSPAIVDLENDGTPDLFFTCAGFYMGFPDRAVSFILRNQGGVFELAEGLLPNEDVPTWEEGLAAADFDQDGRLDFLTGGLDNPPRLLWNRLPGGQTLAIRLAGTQANAQGIGARVTVEAPGLPIQVREMYPGGATWGYSDTQLLFGLGGATQANVTVDWRPAGGEIVQSVEAAPGALLIREPD